MPRAHGRRVGPPAIVIWTGRDSGLSGTNQGNTEFVHPNVSMNATGTEDDAEAINTSPITATKLLTNVSQNNVDNESTFTLRDEGADTTLSVSIPAGATGNFSAEGQVAIDAERAITLEIVAGGGDVGDTLTVEKWALEFEVRP